MAKKCDNKSVGIVVRDKDARILMIERRKFPFGFAPVAGHVDKDGDDYEAAAVRETAEEVGLKLEQAMLVLDKILENQFDSNCGRGGGEGPWHHWKVYRADKWSGEVERSEDETKQARWVSMPDLLSLAARTEAYINGKIPESEWGANTGLEEVWYRIFKILEII